MKRKLVIYINGLRNIRHAGSIVNGSAFPFITSRAVVDSIGWRLLLFTNTSQHVSEAKEDV